MQFLSSDVGIVALEEVKHARRCIVISAYCAPDSTMVRALRACRISTLIFSAEYAVNDPHRLEALANTVTVKCVEPDSPGGKLHAKVVLCERMDGSEWALVGSANYTHLGWFTNQEAAISLDSREVSDASTILRIRSWVKEVVSHASAPDWDQAKAIFSAQARRRLVLRVGVDASETERRYWVLKTRSSTTRINHWKSFLAENVVAVGWSRLGVDPAGLDRKALVHAVSHAYPEKRPYGAAVLENFVGMANGDIVIVANGYTAQTMAPVHVYGVARIEGPFWKDWTSNWWKHKHPAVIQPIEAALPKGTLEACFGKGSMRQTLHKITPKAFRQFCDAVRELTGITIAL
jgi:hypothetical protein